MQLKYLSIFLLSLLINLGIWAYLSLWPMKKETIKKQILLYHLYVFSIHQLDYQQQIGAHR